MTDSLSVQSEFSVSRAHPGHCIFSTLRDISRFVSEIAIAIPMTVGMGIEMFDCIGKGERTS